MSESICYSRRQQKNIFPLPGRRSASNSALRPPAAMKTGRSLQGQVCIFLFFQGCLCNIRAVTNNIFMWNINPVLKKKIKNGVYCHWGTRDRPWLLPLETLAFSASGDLERTQALFRFQNTKCKKIYKSLAWYTKCSQRINHITQMDCKSRDESNEPN